MSKLIPKEHYEQTFAEIENLDPCGNRGFAENQQPQGPELAENLRKTCGFQKTPIPQLAKAPEYPTEALGPILGKAAERLAYYTQTAKGMAGQGILTASALVAQSHINVKRGGIGTGPVSIYAMTVAESGGRKSTADRLALKPVRDFEQARRDEHKQQLAEYRAEMEAWKLRRDSIISAHTPKGRKLAMAETQERQLAEDLAAHEATQPSPPEFPNITFEEPTAEGVWRHFQYGRPSAGLFSDEGVSFFNGHGMSAEAKGRTIGTLSGLWDGKPMTRTRATEGESGVMANRRLSAHLMVQPIVAAEVLSDPLLLDQGFLARFLVCWEPSIAGTRFLSNRDPDESAWSDPAIQAYWQRLAELLALPLDVDAQSGELRPEVLAIEGEAYAHWVQWHDAIESQLAKGGSYRDVQAFASKAAENLARIAAVLSWIERSQITPQHIDRAGELTEYYLNSMTAHASNAQQDRDALEAGELLEWIQEHGGTLGANGFNALPGKFRSAKVARKLLGLLVHMGHLSVTANGRSGKPAAWEVVTDAQP